MATLSLTFTLAILVSVLRRRRRHQNNVKSKNVE